MARLKTTNTPDLQSLLAPQTPQNPVMLAVEQALMHGRDWSASVADQIAVRLAGLITLDVIHAGQRLLENDICEVLEVSRAPVREALRILERERTYLPDGEVPNGFRFLVPVTLAGTKFEAGRAP